MSRRKKWLIFLGIPASLVCTLAILVANIPFKGRYDPYAAHDKYLKERQALALAPLPEPPIPPATHDSSSLQIRILMAYKDIMENHSTEQGMSALQVLCDHVNISQPGRCELTKNKGEGFTLHTDTVSFSYERYHTENDWTVFDAPDNSKSNYPDRQMRIITDTSIREKNCTTIPDIISVFPLMIWSIDGGKNIEENVDYKIIKNGYRMSVGGGMPDHQNSLSYDSLASFRTCYYLGMNSIYVSKH
jgi:hypothetical protein